MASMFEQHQRIIVFWFFSSEKNSFLGFGRDVLLPD
jgi:hypothetical protein